MPDFVLHPHTRDQLDKLQSRPTHAVLLVGPSGIGKTTVAAYLAAALLEIPQDKLISYPHLRHIQPLDGKAIGIETVRELEHFLALKIPGSKSIARIAIIEDAHRLTLEAQNALLKTLEEPPADTALILTTAYEHALLPTIRSRVRSITIQKPSDKDLKDFFSEQATPDSLDQAFSVSGGLPGLTAALLSDETEHPLVEAVRLARDLLQKPAYERLLAVDELVKRKSLARDMCFVLKQMAQLAIGKNGSARWQAVLKAAYEADEALTLNAQPKLVLVNLMLML